LSIRNLRYKGLFLSPWGLTQVNCGNVFLAH
jgi:hypothetical protein